MHPLHRQDTTLTGHSVGLEALFTSSHRFTFNGKESDSEVSGEGNQQDYGLRIYTPALGRFLSVDPLYQSYPWNSTYAFCENRPIDGIDLDGGEWKSQHKWSDEIKDEALIKKLGDNYVKGMTYEQAWKFRAGAILSKNIGENRDCFNTAVRALIEFAAYYKLPFNVKDHKAADDNGKKDPEFDNDNYGYKNKKGEWVKFKEGDWQALADAVGDYYGAADAYGNPNLTVPEAADKWEPGLLMLKKSHILTITKIVPGLIYDDIYYIQGNLDDNKKATPVEEKHASKFSLNTIWGGSQRKWNFKAFDNAQKREEEKSKPKGKKK